MRNDELLKRNYRDAEWKQLYNDTVLPQCRDMSYLGLGLSAETGEVTDILKKIIRGNEPITVQQRSDLIGELGDVLWYVHGMLTELQAIEFHAFNQTYTKLTTRKQNGTIHER